MEDKDILKGRIHDLINKANKYYSPVSSKFFSYSEISIIKDILKEEKLISSEGMIGDLNYFFFGGKEECDSQCLFLAPSIFDPETIKKEDNSISCLHIYPKNVKFADSLTHRDVLGSIMNLGYKRDEFGDIYLKENDIYVFILSEIATNIKEELKKIKHTTVEVDLLSPSSCPYKNELEERNINISSPRLDAIIAETFFLSRNDAQELILGKNVFSQGKTLLDNDHLPKEEERISVKGYGKFIYLGIFGKTRKDRLIAKIKIYK